VFVSQLRRIIEREPDHPERIQTVAGVGYRFLPGCDES
jgi:DNA-binding response OmpR family regulator